MQQIFFDQTGTASAIVEKLTELEDNFKSVIVLSCDNNNLDILYLNSKLQTTSLKVIGGIFPSIIYQQNYFDRGTVIVAFKQDFEIDIIENISQDISQIEIGITDLFEEIEELQTILLFVDGFSKNITTLIDELYSNVGLEANYIGGGAGSLSFEQKHVVITNRGVLQDSVVLAHIPFQSSIGVTHGWKPIGGPHQVTKSQGNRVIELDYRPAFSVYKSIVENHSGEKFDDTNFFDIAKGYPFGINKLDSEKVVRDPILVNEKEELICVGDVPENSYVDILNGNNQTLIEAAFHAKEKSLNNLSQDSVELAFFIDCISRVLFLKDQFIDELNAVKIEGKPLVGALTLGEIANRGDQYLEFYNKTSVFATLLKE